MRFLILAVLLIAAPAFAQQPPPSPNEPALWAKLGREINEGIACNANLVALQAEIQKLQARIKELEPKPAEDGTKKN